MNPKIQCSIPFCRGWTRQWPEGCEVICARHWRKIPVRYRRHYKAVLRRYEATADAHHSAAMSGQDYDQFMRIDRLKERHGNTADRAWERCKRIATETSAGVR